MSGCNLVWACTFRLTNRSQSKQRKAKKNPKQTPNKPGPESTFLQGIEYSYWSFQTDFNLLSSFCNGRIIFCQGNFVLDIKAKQNERIGGRGSRDIGSHATLALGNKCFHLRNQRTVGRRTWLNLKSASQPDTRVTRMFASSDMRVASVGGRTEI